MKFFFEMFFTSLFLLALYILSYYGAFYVCLSDDVEFNYGKNRMKNRRKKQKGFLKKFLFLDIKNEVIQWHYIAFWVNLISFIIALIAWNIYIIYINEVIKIILIITGVIFFLTSTIITFVRWPLYRGNKVRSRKKYRKNKKWFLS